MKGFCPKSNERFNKKWESSPSKTISSPSKFRTKNWLAWKNASWLTSSNILHDKAKKYSSTRFKLFLPSNRMPPKLGIELLTPLSSSLKEKSRWSPSEQILSGQKLKSKLLVPQLFLIGRKNPNSSNSISKTLHRSPKILTMYFWHIVLLFRSTRCTNKKTSLWSHYLSRWSILISNKTLARLALNNLERASSTVVKI